jgi:hypothetical protein
MHVFLVRYCDELCIASIHAVRKKTAYLFDKVNLWPNTWFSIWKPVIYRILYKKYINTYCILYARSWNMPLNRIASYTAVVSQIHNTFYSCGNTTYIYFFKAFDPRKPGNSSVKIITDRELCSNKFTWCFHNKKELYDLSPCNPTKK